MQGWTTAEGTSVGLVRRENQDVSAVSADGKLLAVADGMGGMVDGGKAARLAVDATVEAYATGSPIHRGDAIARGFSVGQRRVARTPNSGTTLVVALVEGDTAVIGHGGDSRAYLMRPGSDQLERLTADHTAFPGSNALHRYVGYPGGCVPDLAAHYLPPGAILMLCSDGVWGPVPADEMKAILRPSRIGPERRVRALIDAALRHGGPDNATVVIGQRA